MADFTIYGATVADDMFDEDSVYNINIKNGVIASLYQVPDKPEIPDAGGVDGRGLVLFPGLIDPHIHFNEPGRTDWEGLETGTAALAKGGVTSFFDMPLNSSPVTTTVEAFDEKRRLMDEKSRVNGYLWGGLVPKNLNNLEALAERGVIGFKAFMSNSGIDEFQAADDATIYKGMQILSPLGKILAVHAENDTITSVLAADARKAGRVGVRDYLNSRPAIAEIEAIQRLITLAGETGCKLHIVHVSTGRGFELVRQAQALGVDVTCETCPHYLVLTDEDVERLGAVAKCAPPIRSKDEQNALWSKIADDTFSQADDCLPRIRPTDKGDYSWLYFRDTTLPMIGSDHSPAPMSLKQGDDFFKIWGGIAGCQSTLSLLLTYGYYEKRLTLKQIAKLTSANVAKRFGLNTKGHIQVNSDADLTLVDINSEYTLKAEDLEYKHKISPYVGMTLRGSVVKTWVKGELVYG